MLGIMFEAAIEARWRILLHLARPVAQPRAIEVKEDGNGDQCQRDEGQQAVAPSEAERDVHVQTAEG